MTKNTNELLDRDEQTAGRLRRGLGWLLGGLVGLGIALLVAEQGPAEGESGSGAGPFSPLAITSFVGFAVGAYAGMWAADRLGERSVQVLSLLIGVLLSIALLLWTAWRFH